ncbi:MAG: transcriptional regulator [Microcystis wesenbergii Mw_QC_B_20070930_S4]|jgi:ATP-dependent DNA helicase RecG|nr:MAG: transcriptional regulator [Microcystis wesenbergii Mw_QC_B_20070930_S4D]TRV10738.1 MAG: transcriptional regulator [Microcystis wesenbergii Mw_QC_B_20070930_S4]
MLTFDELWELLIAQDESVEIEAKKASEVGKSCWETISAFANEFGLGGGYLLLGIKSPQNSDSKTYEIEGLTDLDKIQTDLSCQCASAFNIPIRPQIEVAPKDGKIVMVVFVPEAQPSEKPVFIKNKGLPRGAYRRISSTDQSCSDRDMERFYQERSYQTYDTTPIPEATLDDLDPDAIAAYRRERKAFNPDASELNYDDRELLYSLNAIVKHPTQKGEYCLTFAGLILFGNAITLRRHCPMHRIDYILVEGKEWVADPDKRFQVVEVREPLLLAIPRLITLVLNDLPKAFSLDENGIHRRETPIIPRRVIREAIVNAVMHRNYRERSPVQIIRFSDRLEIRNPGYSLKPTDEFDQPTSKTRNEKIATVLHEVNMAETKGSGGKIMLDKMLEANLTLPLFVSNRDKDDFRVTLFTHHLLDEEDIQWLTQFKNHTLSPDETKALVVLRQVGMINNLIYRVTNDVDTLTASHHLRRLRDAGLLEQQGKGSATCYTLASGAQSARPDRDKDSNPESNGRGHSLSGQQDTSNPDSSTEGAKSLSGQQDTSNLDSSTKGAKSLSGQQDTSNLDSSTFASKQLELDLFAVVESESLKERLASLGKRPGTKEIRELILDLCEIKDRSSSELASLLQRSRKHLLCEHIKPLIQEGELEYTNPEKLNDPHQTYRTTRQYKKI